MTPKIAQLQRMETFGERLQARLRERMSAYVTASVHSLYNSTDLEVVTHIVAPDQGIYTYARISPAATSVSEKIADLEERTLTTAKRLGLVK